MSTAVDTIQIVSQPNLEKIQNFLNNSTYRETIEYSANFNSRLCLERRLRLPFFDPQTNIAQNHTSLFMDRRLRMPGIREGQIYTYPAARWRKGRREYLLKQKRPFGILRRGEPAPSAGVFASVTTTPSTAVSVVSVAVVGPAPSNGSTVAAVTSVVGTTGDDSDFNGTMMMEESSSLGGADTSDSKDSQNLKEELPKEWFYDEIDINNIDDLEEPKSPDDEYDYDPRYGNKKRKKRRPGRKATTPIHHVHHDGPRKGRPPGGGGSSGSSSGVGRGRGRRKNTNSSRAPTVASEMPRSPNAEPPSFDSVAAAVEGVSSALDNDNSNSGHGDLRNYRKYLWDDQHPI